MQMYCGTKLIQPYCYQIGGNNSLIHVAIKGESGTNYMFRYFKLIVYSIRKKEKESTDTTLQFSKLKFIDANKNAFEYPPEMIGYPRFGKIDEYSKYGFTVCDSEEYPVAGTSDASNRKCCMRKQGSDHYILYDLGSECLNVKTFNRWSWWSSNDSWTEGRYMDRFAMYISNDLNNWIEFDVAHKSKGPDYEKWPTKYNPYVEMYVSDYFDYRGKL